jgi:hypothetical protein
MKKDLRGEQFGQWLVITEATQKNGRRYWWCECSCGNKKEVSQLNLTQGKSTKCKGCTAKQRSVKHGYGQDTSGLYSVWKSMKTRCLNANHKSYKYYGGRGISLCEGWLTFEGFLRDMGEGYDSGLTLERVDNTKGYSRENCKWATRAEQNSNTRRTLRLEYQGKTYTERQLADLTGVPRTTIQTRRKMGLSGEELVNGPRKV